MDEQESDRRERVTPPSAPSLSPAGCVLLPPAPSSWCYQVSSTNASENNRAVELYWQLGEATPRLAAQVDLLVHLMYEHMPHTQSTPQS